MILVILGYIRDYDKKNNDIILVILGYILGIMTHRF